MSAEEDLFGSSDEEDRERAEQEQPREEVEEESTAVEGEREEIAEEEQSSAAATSTTVAQGEPIEIQVGDIPRPNPASEMFVLRLPATVPIVSCAFEAETFAPKPDTPSASADAIRWRHRADGSRESNARLVRWSDGTTQLLVGSTAYDVFEHDARGWNHHAFASFRGVAQGQGAISARLVVQPLTARSHGSQQPSSSSLGQASAAASGTKMKVRLVDDGQEDPERALERLRRMEIERGRNEASLEAKRRKREASFGSLDPDMLEDGDLGAATLSAEDVAAAAGRRPSVKRSSAANEAEEREAEQRILQAKSQQPLKRAKQ